jgi:ribosomal-protein-alanine N-acetyltransferase
MAAARVVIRPLAIEDMKAFLAAAAASAALHRPWVSAPDTPVKFRAYLKRSMAPQNRSFVVCRKNDGALAGVINISEIVRGNFLSGYLGYYAFAGHEGQGLMKEGLRAVVKRAFAQLKLHRLEANIQPGNAASIALAKACGFRREGLSPRYLKVRGRWRDHERWAITAD